MIYIVTEEYNDYEDHTSNMVCATFSREKAEEIVLQKEKEIKIIMDLKSKVFDSMSKWIKENPEPKFPFNHESSSSIRIKYNKDYVEWSILYNNYRNCLIETLAIENDVSTDFTCKENYLYAFEELEIVE